jgi:hypothetical protein
MAITKTNPLKNDPVEGYEEDFDPNVDAVNARGVYVQDDSSNDTNVVITRDASGNLTLKDGLTGPYTLTQLSTGGGGISEAQHRALRQLIHFIDNGPTNGFASGAFRENLPSANPFVTSVTWWTTSGKTHKIVEKLITYTGVLATTVQWKMYDTDGSTVLATVTDAITYSGIFESDRTRTIA